MSSEEEKEVKTPLADKQRPFLHIAEYFQTPDVLASLVKQYAPRDLNIKDISGVITPRIDGDDDNPNKVFEVSLEWEADSFEYVDVHEIPLGFRVPSDPEHPKYFCRSSGCFLEPLDEDVLRDLPSEKTFASHMVIRVIENLVDGSKIFGVQCDDIFVGDISLGEGKRVAKYFQVIPYETKIDGCFGWIPKRSIGITLRIHCLFKGDDLDPTELVDCAHDIECKLRREKATHIVVTEPGSDLTEEMCNEKIRIYLRGHTECGDPSKHFCWVLRLGDKFANFQKTYSASKKPDLSSLKEI